MSGKKSTAAEVEMRTAKVAELLVNGWNRTRICEYARETAQWGVSDGQIDRYIATLGSAFRPTALKTSR